MSLSRLASSFRDPAGFLFQRDGTLLRQVNHAGAADYDLSVKSGLLGELIEAGLLVPHQEVDVGLAASPDAHRVLRPERVPQLSYPYEWCFSQLKDAALLTLELQARALAKGLALRDASAYNVQFVGARPLLIDTLSFGAYEEGSPWVAYRQFCQHFLAPLALMSKVDIRLGQLSRQYIDGVPLDLASALLPWSSRFGLGLGVHIHLHAKSQKKHAGRARVVTPKGRMSRHAMLGLLDSLKSTVLGLRWLPGGTEWLDYYEANNNYGDASLKEKESIVSGLLARMAPKLVWDLGGNTGRFSRLATAMGALAVCWDIDQGCVEASYNRVRTDGERRLLPLFLDLTNPSPAQGWAHEERQSLRQRGPADVVMALGLIHHLAIANNVPLARVAAFFAELAPRLILELVPKEDSQVQKLLASREDVFPTYGQAGLESAFAEYFEVEERLPVPGTCRTIYALKRR